MVDAIAFTVPAAKFIKHKVEKTFLERANMEEPFSKLAEAVDKKKVKKNMRFQQKHWTQFDSQALRRAYPTTEKQLKGVQYIMVSESAHYPLLSKSSKRMEKLEAS